MLILWKRGSISSLHIDNATERTTPYIYTLICFGFWCYFIGTILKMPFVWLIVAIGASLALLAVTIINHWWKISAHLTALGGLLGGICSISLYYNVLPSSLIIGILILSLLLMYARLYLNAHTPLQVVCGYILGIVCTFTPNLIIYYA
jgi:membrane-associated phospholipid phosphatase